MINTDIRKIEKNIRAMLVIAVLVAVDQAIKYAVVLLLKPIGKLTLLPGILRLNYVENDGAMMGFMQGRTEIMTIAAILCMVFVVFLLFTDFIKTIFDYIFVVMIAAGGIGNIIDRLVRGFVVDYIEVLFVDFYVFNFADCLITVGAFLMVIYQIVLIFKENAEKRKG